MYFSCQKVDNHEETIRAVKGKIKDFCLVLASQMCLFSPFNIKKPEFSIALYKYDPKHQLSPYSEEKNPNLKQTKKLQG